MALTPSNMIPLGTVAPAFTLHDVVSGKTASLAELKGDAATVVMFICNHCPYVKAILEDLVKETAELKKLGINTVAIMSNNQTEYPEDSSENMKKIADSHHFSFPYLVDETQEIAKAYGAVCTPDFFGYNKDLKLQYRGRLDDRVSATSSIPGKTRELFSAMQAIAKTGKGPREQTPSMGCSIKWK